METVFTYTDYRRYLRDAIDEKRQKNPRLSYRAAATLIGISSGSLTRIMNGSRHAGTDLVKKLIVFLRLKRREAEYFTRLVQFESAKDERQRRICYQAILKMRSERTSPIPEENHQFFEQWYHVALFELLRTIKKPVDCVRLGAMLLPPISPMKTRKALELLERLGYIKMTDGSPEVAAPFLTTGDTWEGAAIHAFQVAIAEHGVIALNAFSKEERDFSTLTMALSEEAFSKVRDIIKQARAEIATVEQACTDPDRVYQINFQCFPLSIKPNDGDEPHHEE